ncbi:MAG: peptide chain release factor 1 [Candidatus Marinimicrobia bacterium]|nr:peptide chain release factor 1 [Candidatus Neomarinimicrobiota bacterium]|tara:strand:+ start:17755 stop:18816 length:1062 start_codon:yes stop_codon:yes gene_type:complete
MLDKAKKIIGQYKRLSEKISNPEIINNHNRLAVLAKEQSDLENLYKKCNEYVFKKQSYDDNQSLINDDDLEIASIAKEENEHISKEIEAIESKLKILFIPKDPNDKKNIILEIRAGTGGSEACLFANDLYRMYIRFSEIKKWKVEIINISENEGGGLKEAILSIKGDNVFGEMKFESGVHRVQRVPDTESSGRLHTSAATVAVLPEAEEVDVEVNDSEIKIDTYRASGAGGQHVNKTESAIRITHIPSGLVVTCQDESSQHKNKDKAMKVLRTRLFEHEQLKRQKEISQQRKSMVSTGDRSAKIRTYNFPQNRITDHRINATLYKLDHFINGDLFELIQLLQLEEQKISLEDA